MNRCKKCGGLFYPHTNDLKFHKEKEKKYCNFGFKWCNKVLKPYLTKDEQMKCGTWSFGWLMTCNKCWDKYLNLNLNKK